MAPHLHFFFFLFFTFPFLSFRFSRSLATHSSHLFSAIFSFSFSHHITYPL
jgi:hypothetical protein